VSTQKIRLLVASLGVFHLISTVTDDIYDFQLLTSKLPYLLACRARTHSSLAVETARVLELKALCIFIISDISW